MVEYGMDDIVCLHLQQVADIEEEPVPYEASTPGIAEAVELGTETIADRVELLSTLSELPQAGLLEQRTAQVEELGETRNVYALTTEGREYARERRGELRDEELVVRTADTETRVTLATVEEYIDAATEDPVVTALAHAQDSVLALEDDAVQQIGDISFVDRKPELSELQGRFQRALAGDPQTLFVCGEPGVGKTTLVRRFEETVDEHDGRFLYGRCDSDVSEPYQPFITAASDLPEADRQQLREILTETPGVETADREALEAQRQSQFYDVGTVLADRATDQPLCLFVDDLQWVDRSSALLLASLARRVDRGRLLLVGACRPETATGDWPLAQALDELDDSEYAWLDVAPLDREWTGRLARHTVGTLDVPESFVDALYERTDGNPLFVTESVRHMLERRDIDPESGVYPDSPAALSVPEEVERTVSSRLGVLDEETRSLLELGSVVGDTIPRPVLEHASTLDGPQLLDYAGVIAGSGIWRYEEAQETLYFQSGVVRETVQANIDDERWHALHERVADAYRTVDEDEHAATIAYHYREAGTQDLALEYYERAGQQATDIFAHEVAIDAYERAVEIARELGREDRVVAALESLGDIYEVLDEYDDAMRCYEFVLERADDTERRQRMYRKQASVADGMGDYDWFFDVVEDGLSLADESDASTVETARLHSIRGRGLRIQGEFDEALSAHERALALVENGVGHADDERALFRKRMGNTYQSKGQINRALDVFEEVVERRRDGDDRQKLAGVLSSYGNALSRTSEYDRAVAVYEEAHDIFEAVGDRGGVMTVLNNLGITYQHLDDNERAIDCFEDGIDIARTTENSGLLASLSINLGYAHVNLGEFDAAVEYATEAHDLGERIGDPTMVACTHEIRALERRYRADLDAARDSIAEGLDVARDAQARNRIAGSLSILGDVQLDCSEHEAARASFEEGIEISLEYGNRQKATVNRAGLVRTLVTVGDTDRASEHVESLAEIEGMAEDTTPALAAFYRERGEYERAHAQVEDGFEQLEDATKPVTECELLLESARIYAAADERERASDRAQQARELAAEHDATLLVERAETVLNSAGEQP
jgi:tetratricopeptide (TPR) repeat protein/DNA-binding PadR family transcriptional regulator